MKNLRLLLILVLALTPFARPAHSQQKIFECVVSTSTACPDSGTNPGNGTQGLPIWQAGGFLNDMFHQVYGMWGPMSSFLATGVLTNADILGVLAPGGPYDATHCPSGAGTMVACGGSGSGSTPGGTSGQSQWNNGGVLAGYTMSQDCTLNTATGVITCTKTNNVAFGPWATSTDTASGSGSTLCLTVGCAINLGSASNLLLSGIASQLSDTLPCNPTNASSALIACTPAQALAVLNAVTCNVQTGTSYSAAIADADSCIAISNAAANTGTVPPNSSVPFPVNAVLTWQELGTGITTVAPGSGVTFCSLMFGCSATQTYSLCGPYDAFQLKQTSANTWTVTQPPCLVGSRRVWTVASGTSISPTIGRGGSDQVNQANTASGGTLTMNNPSGSPADTQSLVFRITSANVQTFSWGTAYHAGSAALPTATTGSSKHDYIAFIYDAATSQWDYVATAAGF
ncbi:MAG: hypothetical protein KGL39_15385 [Patescibacteria group bacterium]|nr:hypothetical protein [Patescibacteria group bacterium]